MATRSAQATWEGTLKEGSGVMRMASGSYEGPYTYATRFVDETGTSPEELIAAAHAGCFSMHLSGQLGNAGFPARQINTTAHVTIESGTINKIVLETEVDAPGLTDEVLQEKAAFSKENCPVSKALKAVGDITVTARLKQ